MSTMTLIEFLLARIAEDERAAKTAGWSCPAPWSMNESSAGDSRRTINDSEDDNLFDAGYSDTYPNASSAVTFHIARFDPARILAECAAKHALMEGHVGAREYWRDQSMPYDWCVGCGRLDECDPVTDDVDECPTLRALAAVYSDHPAYQSDWAVAA
jgi:hypothetical protein